jgi:aspartyl-tRNA(Asn)/glutamyl-tRNA(Gln) amidotransferase subunit C
VGWGDFVDIGTVRRVARIARLRLTPEEEERFAKDLEEILAYMDVLDEAEASDRHDFNPVPVKDVLREDVEGRDVDAETLLDSMDTYERMVRGPKLS